MRNMSLNSERHFTEIQAQQNQLAVQVATFKTELANLRPDMTFSQDTLAKLEERVVKLEAGVWPTQK